MASSHRGYEDDENFVNGVAADPGLDAEPTAGHESAEERRDIRADGAERGATINGKWDAVVCSCVRVEDHRNEHDEVAQENRDDCLPPIHSTANKRRGEHIGGNAGGHRNP